MIQPRDTHSCHAALPGRSGRVQEKLSRRKQCMKPQRKGYVLCESHLEKGGESVFVNGVFVPLPRSWWGVPRRVRK